MFAVAWFDQDVTACPLTESARGFCSSSRPLPCEGRAATEFWKRSGAHAGAEIICNPTNMTVDIRSAAHPDADFPILGIVGMTSRTFTTSEAKNGKQRALVRKGGLSNKIGLASRSSTVLCSIRTPPRGKGTPAPLRIGSTSKPHHETVPPGNGHPACEPDRPPLKAPESLSAP